MGKTPSAKARDKQLRDAIRAADVEGARTALAAGAKPMAKWHGMSALCLVVCDALDCEGGRDADYMEIAESLLQHGADIDFAAADASPLELAIRSEHWVEWLLAHGASPDSPRQPEGKHYASPPPLGLAVVTGRRAQVERLLAAGAQMDFTCRTSSGTRWLLAHATHRSSEVSTSAQYDISSALLRSERFCPEHASAGLKAALVTWEPPLIALFVSHGARPDDDFYLPLQTAFEHKMSAVLEAVAPLFSAEEWQELCASNSPDRASLGVAAYEAEERPRAELGAPAGAIIRGIFKESPALIAGLQLRDVIVSLDGAAIECFSDLSTRVSGHSIGERLALSFWRAGRGHETSVILGARVRRGFAVVDDDDQDLEP